MLSIHPSSPQKCTPNLLPACISHSGPINDTERYWKPETDDKGTRSHVLEHNDSTSTLLTLLQGTQHVYFRGRHLHGTPIALPANYTGAVLNVTDKTLPTSTSISSSNQRHGSLEDQLDDDAEGESGDMDEDVKIAEQVGEFENIVVWEHGGKVDEEKDAYVRGIREWVGWAESMHVDEDEDGDKEDEGEDGKKIRG